MCYVSRIPGFRARTLQIRNAQGKGKVSHIFRELVLEPYSPKKGTAAVHCSEPALCLRAPRPGRATGVGEEQCVNALVQERKAPDLTACQCRTQAGHDLPELLQHLPRRLISSSLVRAQRSDMGLLKHKLSKAVQIYRKHENSLSVEKLCGLQYVGLRDK
ncbi:hypothetical protein NDU88_004327 [Pleurodeles waltl]|uniref:Uncharacterized protein n=1 Tax=Pleurodeles waltl TaxID=8319 RepID=A0AAV7L167_PLEWA|nr:hypothetical protein NDU88_004327 [Pleurodeles waltl]